MVDYKIENIPVINVAEKMVEYGILKSEVPEYITSNLKHSFFDWQQKALRNLLHWHAVKAKEKNSDATHLMFNMATGAGKTLLMAATILYYYKQDYRHFLFFVNQKNIVDKTETNFLENTHPKYLFKEKIVIDNNTVHIKQVETFSDNPQSIEIKFTTVHKLYNDIHIQKENQTTLDDLHTKNIVMLADEAHHLNANTKNIHDEIEIDKKLTDTTNKNTVEKKGWENTIIKHVLHKNGKKGINKNVLLEFTATIPENEAVVEKYKDKVIYKFGLKDFLQRGYTKEINLISSTLNPKERILQALLFQWYRHDIALKHNISNFKPVILFRSKTIEESRADYEEFLVWIDTISGNDFQFTTTILEKITQSKNVNEQGNSRTQQVLQYIKNNNISYSTIAEWIKQNFKEKNVIITNSKNNKTKTEQTDIATEKLLNNLEDKHNHIRAIFTVKCLTEGWDVLNLFDIVRLYQGQNAGGSTRKTPEATTQEKQLIGRGVRYFPFSYENKQRNKRKFDDDLQHELRVLEELYYYTDDEDSRYISHLKAELKKDGYINDNKIAKTFALKETFQQTEFYKNTKIWYNERINNPDRKEKSLSNITQGNLTISYKVPSLELKEQEIDWAGDETKDKATIQAGDSRKITQEIKYMEKHIFLKAVNVKATPENSLFQFEQLSQQIEIKSIDDLQTIILADCSIEFITSEHKTYDDIENWHKLEAISELLDAFANTLKESNAPTIGSEFKAASFSKFFNTPKTKSIENGQEDKDIPKNEWYALDTFVGTDQEKALVKFIKDIIGNLKDTYQEIYLVRNEEVYKIYDFKEGRGFQPDFLLFLTTKKKYQVKENIQMQLSYQIFIEPKQEKLMTSDDEKWKEEFLLEITHRYGFENVIVQESPHYRLIGFPFFNDGNKLETFKTEFKKLLPEKDK